MGTGVDRRQVARLTVPRRWGGGDLELHLVRLLDLSALGARIAHREPLHAGGIGSVELPPALGAARVDPAPPDRAHPGRGPAPPLRKRPGVHQPHP